MSLKPTVLQLYHKHSSGMHKQSLNKSPEYNSWKGMCVHMSRSATCTSVYFVKEARRFSEESFLIRGKTARMCRKMLSLPFKMCIECAVYVINNSIVHEGFSIFTLQYCYWAYMTFDPHSGSGTTLVPSCSRPPSLSVSSVHSMTSVMWTLTSLWRGLTWTNCGPHLYCESIPTGCTVELL